MSYHREGQKERHEHQQEVQQILVCCLECLVHDCKTWLEPEKLEEAQQTLCSMRSSVSNANSWTYEHKALKYQNKTHKNNVEEIEQELHLNDPGGIFQ